MCAEPGCPDGCSKALGTGREKENAEQQLIPRLCDPRGKASTGLRSRHLMSGIAQCRGCLGMAQDRGRVLALLPLQQPFAEWKGGEKRNRNFSLESHHPKTERRSES